MDDDFPFLQVVNGELIIDGRKRTGPLSHLELIALLQRPKGKRSRSASFSQNQQRQLPPPVPAESSRRALPPPPSYDQSQKTETRDFGTQCDLNPEPVRIGVPTKQQGPTPARGASGSSGLPAATLTSVDNKCALEFSIRCIKEMSEYTPEDCAEAKSKLMELRKQLAEYRAEIDVCERRKKNLKKLIDMFEKNYKKSTK